MSDTTRTKSRTITLTDRPPVTIREDQWPVIARAVERPGSFINGTPIPHHETDEYSIRVRQHEDGRALVYGVVDAATVWTHTEDWRGGELLDAGADIARAIRRVGEAGGMPDSVVRDCIADLPAQEL